jgi:hypothetical protein
MVNRVKKAARVVQMLKDTSKGLLGKNLSRALNQSAIDAATPMPSFKKGGMIKKTGKIYAHKGEVVLTASAAKTLRKLLNK